MATAFTLRYVQLQVVACVVFAIAGAAADSFQFCFKEWPLTSPDNCNPYEGHMDLICRVEGINLDIKWFYSTVPNAENSTNPLQNVTNQYLIQHVYVVDNSVNTVTRSRLRVKDASPGYYWCRAYKNNVALWPVSLKMDLSAEQFYSRYGSCTSDQANMITKCYYVAMPNTAISTTSSVNPPDSSTIAGVLQQQTTTTQPSLPASSTRHQQLSTPSPPANTVGTHRVGARTTTTSSSHPTPSSPVTGRLIGVPDEYQVWLFVVITLTAIFAVLIVVLSVICVGLCVLKSRTASNVHVKGNERKALSSQSSPAHQRRPSTSMTQQTELMICLQDTPIYSTLDRDYEDLDDDKDEPDTELGPSPPPPTSHHQYNTQSVDTELPVVPHYSALASDAVMSTLHTSNQDIIEQLTGYNKLDHTKSRQNYHPNRESPLLSGYRKLDRGFTQSSTSSTLPWTSSQGPYANIHTSHMRSSSISGETTNPINSLPHSPTSTSSPRSRGYLNFQVIEQQETMTAMSSTNGQPPATYHMLQDITADQDMLTLAEQSVDLKEREVQDYEYLPTVETDQAKGYDNLIPIGELDPNSTPAKRALGLLAKDPIAEQMSMDSSHSGDFTGPFMLPHMVKFGDSNSRECQSDNHTYKCLDLSTIEPDQNYAVPAAAKLKRKSKGHNP